MHRVLQDLTVAGLYTTTANFAAGTPRTPLSHVAVDGAMPFQEAYLRLCQISGALEAAVLTFGLNSALTRTSTKIAALRANCPFGPICQFLVIVRNCQVIRLLYLLMRTQRSLKPLTVP